MDEEAWRVFEPFRRFRGPNASNVMRHRIIDDLLRERLALDPRRLHPDPGCWASTRGPSAWRGGDGSRSTSPRSSPGRSRASPCRRMPERRLVRLAVDFESERLSDRLAGPRRCRDEHHRPRGRAHVPRRRGRSASLLRTLRGLFPLAEVICDVMTRGFFEKYARKLHEEIRGLGAGFRVPEAPLVRDFPRRGLPADRERVPAGACRAATLRALVGMDPGPPLGEASATAIRSGPSRRRRAGSRREPEREPLAREPLPGARPARGRARARR